MSIQPGPSPQNDFGSLQGCFVEGNPEQRKREGSIRRRALIISVTAQAAILAAIILVPLFGKPQHIALANMTPIPPYYPSRSPARPDTPARPNIPHQRIISDNVFSQPTHIPNRVDESPEPPSSEPPGIPMGSGPATPCVG